MDISEILQRIELEAGKGPLFFLKFVRKKKYAQQVVDGMLYANTPKYFRECEIKSGKRGQGDRYELTLIIQMKNVTFLDFKSKDKAFALPSAQAEFRYKDDDDIPMVCFVGFPLCLMKVKSYSDTKIDFLFPFCKNDLKGIKKTFGKYCVVVGAETLLRHFNENLANKKHKFGKIEYCELNKKERKEAFANGKAERFFYKNQDLAYQNEYRLVLQEQMPPNNYIEIGELGDNATIIKSKKLNKFVAGVHLI